PVFRDRQELCTLRSIEHCSAPDRDQCDRSNNYKRQISFHRVEEERKTSAQRSNRQVITRTPSHECTQSGEAAAKDLTTDYTDMDRSECVHGILHCLPAVAGSAASRKL